MTLINETNLTSLGRKIKTARILADMKQDDIAIACGVSRSAVGQWEKGDTEPSATKLILVARATEQPLGWFAEGLDLGGAHKSEGWGFESLRAHTSPRHALDGAFLLSSLDAEYEALCIVEAVAL